MSHEIEMRADGFYQCSCGVTCSGAESAREHLRRAEVDPQAIKHIAPPPAQRPLFVSDHMLKLQIERRIEKLGWTDPVAIAHFTTGYIAGYRAREKEES